MKTINEFLLCETPDAWIQEALKHPEIMLIDHANCEKKAAGTALNLMYRYVDNFELLNKMSRLAREELRHFEQVIAIMEARGIQYEQITASRYAADLRKPLRTYEPARLIDTLVVGAIIEARSCERFEKLAPYLDEELEKFYTSLLKSEARHYQDYLTLAEKAAGGESIQDRIDLFLARDKGLVESGDNDFRFHSGVVEKTGA
ncbi:MAG: tRNA isopentenyl-2-thiomethyl-A-37 hydroxylase MiaE [Agarilytica sp.]